MHRALSIVAAILFASCQSLPADDTRPPRELPIFDGHTGSPLTWQELLDRAAEVEVVVLGEMHKDGMGHAVQLAFVEDFVAGPDSALTLEMLERDEQLLIDDYRDGILDAKSFAKETSSTTWAGESSWADWYQPILDAAIAAGARVVAANAPRRYVRAARVDGYEKLDGVGAPRAALFDRPAAVLEGDYRDRFRQTMIDAHASAGTEPTEEDLTALYRSQLLWDATMASSIARTLEAGARRVVHLVGRFHTDFGGGTHQLLLGLRPETSVLTVSLCPEASDAVADDDLGRADVVVYTGRPQ